MVVKPYEAVLDEVRALGSAGKKLWVDPAQVCAANPCSEPITWLANQQLCCSWSRQHASTSGCARFGRAHRHDAWFQQLCLAVTADRA